MLTKSDLSQIRKVVRDEVESETKALGANIQGEIVLSKMELKQELKQLFSRVKNLELWTGKIDGRLNKIDSRIGKLEKEMTKIRKDINFISNYFDKASLELKRRVDRVERHLGLAVG